MATDFQGKTISAGARYLVAGEVRAISGSDVVIVLDDGRALHCDAADLIRVAGYLSLDGADAMTGVLKLANGSASSPAAQFASDTNTGLYRIGADTLGLATAGVERMRINGVGAVGFGVNPSYPVHSYGSGNRVLMVESSSASAAELRLKNTARMYAFGLSAAGAFALTDWTAGTAPFWIQPAAPSFAFFMDAAGKVGFSSLTIDSTVQIGGSFARKSTTITSNHTAGHEASIIANATSGNITITLPACAGCLDREYHVLKKDSSSNTVTIDGAGSETINGATTHVLSSQYDSVTIKCDGTEWFILN